MQNCATQFNVVQVYIFCPVESNQAAQMHLVRSHDKTPDLFADNDGSSDENGDDAVRNYDDCGDIKYW